MSKMNLSNIKCPLCNRPCVYFKNTQPPLVYNEDYEYNCKCNSEYFTYYVYIEPGSRYKTEYFMITKCTEYYWGSSKVYFIERSETENKQNIKSFNFNESAYKYLAQIPMELYGKELVSYVESLLLFL